MEFREGALGCNARRTATEQKMAFESIVKQAFGGDEDASREVFYDIQQSLSDMAEQESSDDEENAPVVLTAENIGEIMAESDIPETAAAMIEESYRQEFADEAPRFPICLIPKRIEAAGKIKRKK